MLSVRHTVALTSAALFALALSASAKNAAPAAGPNAPSRPAAVPPHCDTGIVLSTVDRFTGTTTLKTPEDLDKAISSQSPQLVLMAGKEKGKDISSVILAVRKVTHGGWQYISCHALHFLADDKPFTPATPTLPSLQWSGDAMEGAVSERVLVFVTVPELGRLISASKIEYKVCNDEHVLSAEEMCNARAFYWTIVASK